MKMKAIVINEPGPAENFKFQEVEKPTLRDSHLLIEVKATSVNPIDTKIRGKLLPFSPDYPAILHVDFAGIVKEIPPDVTGFKVGDAVYGVGGGIKGTIGGALAEFLLVDAKLVAPMPKNLSFAEAAALPLVAITAWEALVDKLKITSGSTLLIHGGLGGVGHIALQLGKYFGAIIHTTVSSESDNVILKQLGADYIINYKNSSVEDYVKNLTAGRGFDFIFDTVGGNNLEKSFEAARLNGSIACIATGGAHDLTRMYARGLSLHSVLMLIPLMTGIGRDHYGKILFEITKIVEANKIKPLLHDRVFNWKEVALAHNILESKKHKGKIVLMIED